MRLMCVESLVDREGESWTMVPSENPSLWTTHTLSCSKLSFSDRTSSILFACVYVCERERESERESECVYMLRECVSVYMHVCNTFWLCVCM